MSKGLCLRKMIFFCVFNRGFQSCTRFGYLLCPCFIHSPLKYKDFINFRGLITMQILMPIETNIHTLMVNFHNFGFDLLDALHSVPYLPNVNILLPVLSLNLKATLKETLVSLGLIDLFRKDNSDFAFDDNNVME